MLTVEILRKFGADVDLGIKRCAGNKDFYIDMVSTILKDQRLYALAGKISEKNVAEAFEIAHALKGVYGNLSLTPIFEPVRDVTEILRDGKLDGAKELVDEAVRQFELINVQAA